jgi:hypothetical protein
MGRLSGQLRISLREQKAVEVAQIQLKIIKLRRTQNNKIVPDVDRKILSLAQSNQNEIEIKISKVQQRVPAERESSQISSRDPIR